MGLFKGLREKQEKFDEKWIEGRIEHYVKRYEKLSEQELREKLSKLEQRPTFDSWESSKRILKFGGFGAGEHVADREAEAERRAIRKILESRIASP